MSPVHGTQGQPYARPTQQPQNQWGQQPAQPQAGYGQAGYQNAAHPQQTYPAQNPYAHPAQPASAPQDDYAYPHANTGGSPLGGSHGLNAQGYAPQFEPYVPTQPIQTRSPQQQAYPGGYTQHPAGAPAPTYAQQPAGYGSVPTYAPSNNVSQHSWAQQPDPRGFDLGAYHPSQQPILPGEPGQSQNDWSLGGYQADAEGYAPDPNEQGFAQSAGGELDQGYGEEEAQEYELEEPARSRRPLMMVAVLAGAIAIGGGMTYAYKSILGGTAGGDPPIVKSAEAPTKVKPEDGGGKQFSHTDSKIMGRLGDGSAAPSGEVDPSGTRKVATLVVGRDGSIQPPAAAPAAPGAQASNDAFVVPGMTVVDGLGPSRAPAAAATMAAVTAPAKAETTKAAPADAAPAKIAVAPPPAPPAPQKPVTIAKAPAPAPTEATASIEPAAAAPAKTATKKTKAPVTSNSVATTGNGANGFVAVLASVPRSDSSRMDALKRFADMQQKYSTVLAGKTPDVAEADLGAKGSYHRLVVGPPGSREQASNVCTQLKSQGYSDCWVTAY